MRCSIRLARKYIDELLKHTSDRALRDVFAKPRQWGDEWVIGCDTVDALFLEMLAKKHCPDAAGPIRAALDFAYGVARRGGRRKRRLDVSATVDELDRAEGRPTRSELHALAWRNRFK